MTGVDVRIKSSSITDVGLKREENEDFFLKEDNLGLYVVADGMGGHLAGEVASRVAVEMINKSVEKWLEEEAQEDELFGPPDNTLSLIGNYILSSIRIANRVVYEMALENNEYHGMGTTVVILYVTPNLIIAANVGDSRIYLVRDGHMEMLSKDHTVVQEQIDMGTMTVEEAATSPLRHILTKNLGSAETLDPDIFEIEPSNRDRFILCSDGVTDLVSDDEILEMTQKHNDPSNLCRKLVDMALKRGAHDNATIVSVYLSGIANGTGGPINKIGSVFADFMTGLRKILRL
jgi:serine/threonine protein phosphatase PrpC